jgi:hypothetical protein
MSAPAATRGSSAWQGSWNLQSVLRYQPRVAHQPTTIRGWRMTIFLSREWHRAGPARLHDARRKAMDRDGLV